MIKEVKQAHWLGKRIDLPDFMKRKGAVLSELFTRLTGGAFIFDFGYYFNALTISVVVLGLFME